MRVLLLPAAIAIKLAQIAQTYLRGNQACADCANLSARQSSLRRLRKLICAAIKLAQIA
jgi:hypothetical protein